MSLILDALRKSERSRQQNLTAQLGSGEPAPGPSRLPVPWVTLIGLLLLANGVLLFFLWPRTPAAVPAATLGAAAAYHPAVRPLADEADDTSTPAPAQAAVTSLPAPDAAPQSSATSLPVQTPTVDAASLPTFDALSTDQRQGLPALHMDVHGYSGNPKDRFVVINLKQYRVGDVLDEGPTLKDILPQGAVLEFHGTTFLLPSY